MPCHPASLRQRCFARLLLHHHDLLVELYSRRKEKLLADLRGRVVEIGPGTGVNLRHYHPQVDWIGVEPNAALHAALQQEAATQGRTITLYHGTLGEAPLAAGSADAVVSSLVLCSVPDPAGTLQQVRQLLRPGGLFVYLEHVADEPGTLRRVLQRLAPWTPYGFFADGCNPGRDLAATIASAGFQPGWNGAFTQHGPMALALSRPHIWGVVREPGDSRDTST